MILQQPFSIGSRLLPALTVGGASIALEPVGVKRDRLVWRWYVDLADGQEFSEADLSGGIQTTDSPADTQRMYGTLLSFLAACGEALRYQESSGRESENAALFPAPVAQWARENCDELSSLGIELEETPGLLSHGPEEE